MIFSQVLKKHHVLNHLFGNTTSPEVLKDAGIGDPQSQVSSPANPSVILERFRGVQAHLKNTADISVAQEIVRICNLPIIPEPTQHEIDTISKWYCPDGSWTLFPEQVKAMMQFHEYMSILCPVRVGGGKTLISALVANDAYTHFGKRKIILMNPPKLINQLKETELPLYRRHISINVPFYWLTKEAKGKRMMSAKSGRAGVYVLSYSMISRSEGSELMHAIQPDLIIGDEIHRIASDKPSARNRRFREIVKTYNPSLVSMSGTLTKKTPKNYHHIAVNTLAENCFMPRPVGCADAWSTIIDSNASSIDDFNPSSPPQPGPIKPLIKWAQANWPEEEWPVNLIGFRNAYKRRMETCPGVVSSDSEEGGTPLRISNLKLDMAECAKRPGWELLQKLVKTLLEQYVAPNGDEIDHAMHIWRWRYELEGFGFYNNLFWPEVEKFAARKGISQQEANIILERSIEHHTLRQEYHKVLRRWIKNRARTGMDTPMLLGLEMHNNQGSNVGSELYTAWSDMKDAEFEGMAERQKAVVRVCDFRLKQVVDWAKAWHTTHKNKTAILWFKNRGVGDWINEALLEADLPVAYCPSGKHGEVLIRDRTQGHRFCVASMGSYREGFNLQYHHDTEFFCQWPREADWAEQAMGRIARPGQDSDEARFFTSIGLDFDKVLFASTLNDAAYTHQTTARQKLMYADYDERPMIVPYSVLLEWSGESKPVQLDTGMQKFLNDKFKGQ